MNPKGLEGFENRVIETSWERSYADFKRRPENFISKSFIPFL